MQNSRLRLAAGWLVITVVAAAVGLTGTAEARLLAGADDLAGLVAGLAGAALAGCALWAWLVACVVVAEVGVGRPGVVPGVPGWARRAVLAGCGLAALAASPALDPAVAAVPHPAPASHGGAGTPSVSGLPYPDRALGPAHRTAAPPSPAHRQRIVVAPGDSLWSISASLLTGDADAAEVAALADRLYRLNRVVIGAHPDLIRPGQALRTPFPGGPDRREER